jgi:hypothetical protein
LKKKIKGLVPEELLNERGKIWSTPSKIRKLKNKFKGKRCFVIGNGPSLNQVDISKISDEYSIGSNSIYRKTEEMGFKPTFFTVEDLKIINDQYKEIDQYQCDYMFFPGSRRMKFTNGKHRYFLNQEYSIYNELSPYFETPRFSLDCADKVYCGQSVTIINLQLAYYLGFEKIYLIGMDFNYGPLEKSEIPVGINAEDVVNHFYKEKDNKVPHDPKLEVTLKSFRLCKLMYELDGREIINATVGGKLEVFDRKDYNLLF